MLTECPLAFQFVEGGQRHHNQCDHEIGQSETKNQIVLHVSLGRKKKC